MTFPVIAKAALVAASFFDIGSSAGKQELNPILAQHHQFTVESGVIKMGAIGGLLLLQRHIEKKRPELIVPFSVMNTTMTGITVGIAVHNLTIK